MMASIDASCIATPSVSISSLWDHASTKNNWKVGSKCEVYSRSQKLWINGEITEIFLYNEDEWLVVKYNHNNIPFCKEIEKNSVDVRPLTQYDDDCKQCISKHKVLSTKDTTLALTLAIKDQAKIIRNLTNKAYKLKQSNKKLKKQVAKYKKQKTEAEAKIKILKDYKYKLTDCKELDFRERYGSKGNYTLVTAYIRIEFQDRYNMIIPKDLKIEIMKIYEIMYDEYDLRNECSLVYDPNIDQMVQKCVVKKLKSVNMVPLTSYTDDDKYMYSCVLGGKGLEEKDLYSCGVLELPPQTEKQTETSYFTEQFFVHQCGYQQLLFKLNDDKFYLSKGTIFVVPAENEYSLINVSKIYPVRLVFTLIQPQNDEIVDANTRTQNLYVD